MTYSGWYSGVGLGSLSQEAKYPHAEKRLIGTRIKLIFIQRWPTWKDLLSSIAGGENLVSA